MVKADEITQNVVEQATKGITVENGYLVFQDEKHYGDVVGKISKMTDPELEDFGKRLNFNSKRHTIDAALKALVSLKENQILGDEFKKELKFNADGSYQGTAFPFFNRSVILNNEGIVKVGKEIYVFTNEQFIAIRDGDVSKIEMAVRLGKSSAKDNIFVSNFHTSSTKQPSGQVELRYPTSGSGRPWYNSLFTGTPIFGNDYRCEVNYTWFVRDEHGAPFTPLVYKDFEFNITAMSLLVIRNSPRGNPSETGLTLWPVRGKVFLYSAADELGVPPLTQYFAFNSPIRSNSWLLNFTFATGSRFECAYNAKFGQLYLEGGFHADSYSNSTGNLFVFYLTNGQGIQMD